MWLFIAFLAVPLIEIGLFIEVGGFLGLWPTLAIVVATAVLGTLLVRWQGMQAVGNIQRSINELTNPTEPLAHAAMILISAALLLTPGFFTDGIGFLLLVPGVRLWVLKYVQKRVKVRQAHMRDRRHAANYRSARSGPGVIDGEFEEVSPEDIEEDNSTPPSTQQGPPSGWTRH